jgi:hypothetical protein
VATKIAPERSLNLTPVLIVGVLIIVVSGLLYWAFFRPGAQVTNQYALTPEAKEYIRGLKLSEVEMKATENFMKTTVVEITGKIANNGTRNVRSIEISCVFYDPSGQIILRERVPVVRNKGESFKPGETRSFRLPFDSIPSTWNQTLPQLVIARIEFED